MPRVARALAAHGGTLVVDGVEGVGRVAFHANTLRRAVLNLVENAVDALPQGGTVTVTGHGTADQVAVGARYGERHPGGTPGPDLRAFVHDRAGRDGARVVSRPGGPGGMGAR